jgi:uncharacterized protein (UPF0548 family)
MNIGGLRVGRPSDDDKQRELERARLAALNYDFVGATLADNIDSRKSDSYSKLVGGGPEAFERARQSLRGWAPQRAIGAQPWPPDAQVAPNETVVLTLRWGPFYAFAPDRVVVVIDEPDRFAFAYGAIAGHPERGEESFTIERRSDGLVWATIRLRAAPASLAARMAAPVVRRLQMAALRRYLDAIAQYVANKGEGTP